MIHKRGALKLEKKNVHEEKCDGPHRGPGSRAPCGRVQLVKPRAPRATIAGGAGTARGMSHHVENDVRLQNVAAAHAVVEVEAGARAIEADVVLEERAGRLGLEVAAHLLLEVADLVEKVAADL